MTHRRDHRYTLAELEAHCRAIGKHDDAATCAKYRRLKSQRGAKRC